jgi:hypothetical protein
MEVGDLLIITYKGKIRLARIVKKIKTCCMTTWEFYYDVRLPTGEIVQIDNRSLVQIVR